MRKRTWLAGAAAAAVMLAAAFGLNVSQVNAQDGSAAENLIFEEVGTYDGPAMASDNYTWLGNKDKTKYTVIGSDGTMYDVDNTDGKYGSISYISGFSVDGYIPAVYDAGIKLYNLDGTEAFGGRLLATGNHCDSSNANVFELDGKKYAYGHSENGSMVVDEAGNDITSYFSVDGLKLSDVYSIDSQYVQARYSDDSYNSVIYVYDSNFQRVDIASPDNCGIFNIHKSGDYCVITFKNNTADIYDSNFNKKDVQLGQSEDDGIGSLYEIDGNYFLGFYKSIYDENGKYVSTNYKSYFCDENLNRTDKGQVEGYQLVGFSDYDNYYRCTYQVDSGEYVYKFFNKDFTPYSAQLPSKTPDAPAVYSRTYTAMSNLFNVDTFSSSDSGNAFDRGTYEAPLADGYTMWESGYAGQCNGAYLYGYKVYIGYKLVNQTEETDGDRVYGYKYYSIALFDENGNMIKELATTSSSYSSGGGPVSTGSRFFISSDLSRGDKLVFGGKIIKVSKKGGNNTEGVVSSDNGVLHYYVNGKIDNTYTGMASDAAGNKYWFDNGVAAKEKQVYNSADGAWYWFDADGSMAVGKDVFVPKSNEDRSEGKWVRYDENGHMVKGEDYANGGWYRFDEITGEMAKGFCTVQDGDNTKLYYYNTDTGIMEHGAFNIDGTEYAFDDVTGVAVDKAWYSVGDSQFWYENGVRQGMEGRGKEIYDPASDGWYWLDAIDSGKKAVSKDVYQESFAGAYADREDGTGKWVRYDANGRMIKGWSEQNGSRYYFDLVTGAMAKGTTVIDGQTYTFSWETGALQY